MAPKKCAARREKLVSVLEGESLDGLIVSHLPNIRYLTGFTGSSAILVVSKAESLIVTDPRYRTQIDIEVGDDVRTEIVSTDPLSHTKNILEGYDTVLTIGYESYTLSAQKAEGFSDWTSGKKLKATNSLVEQLRVSKDRDEVEAVRDAAQLATEALDRTLLQVKAGLSEFEVAGFLERELRVGGSEWHPFPTIVASGPRSALPHAETSSREIKPGEFLLLDFGAMIDGYCADISRTVVVGRRADQRQREIYGQVQSAQRLAREEVRAGMTGRDADSLARKPIEEAGLGDAFEHSLGHGLGLEVHEEPRLSKLNENPLPVGSVVTVEPGVYLPGWGGIRIEDDVYLGEDGPVLLSDGNTELRELN